MKHISAKLLIVLTVVFTVLLCSLVPQALSPREIQAQVNGAAVGPELAFFDRGNQESVFRNVVQANGFTGAVQVINEIGQAPFNPAPGTNVSLRIAGLGPETPVSVIQAYAQNLNNSGLFPAGTIVIFGNEVNNLDLEFIYSPTPAFNDAAAISNAARQYATLFNAFGAAIDHSKFRLAPAPPDLYNANWDPVPWIDTFGTSVNCRHVDTLVANVFDSVPRVPVSGGQFSEYLYMQQRICGKPVTRFGGWGANPDTSSVQEQIDFLNNTPLPPGITAATTLIVCGTANVTKSGWKYYVNGQAYNPDGSLVDPENCERTFGNTCGPVDASIHSLRPNPGDPFGQNSCDPTVTQETWMCGNDLVAKETIEVTKDDGTCVEKPLEPGQILPTLACHFSITSTTRLAMDLSRAELPIMGNTEDVPNSDGGGSMSFVDRVNNYVSWYLNGTIQRAEERFFSFPADQDTMLSLSGPIRKLLPYGIQNMYPDEGLEGLRVQQAREVGTTRHDQVAACGTPDAPQACYSQSNTTRTIQQIFANSFQTIPGVLGGLLFSPQEDFDYIPFSSTEDRIGAVNGPSIAGSGGDVAVTINSFIPLGNIAYFAHMIEDSELGAALQGTFLPQGKNPVSIVTNDITDATINAGCIPQETRSNPGDNLYAQPATTVGGQLNYTADFDCDLVPTCDTSCLPQTCASWCTNAADCLASGLSWGGPNPACANYPTDGYCGPPVCTTPSNCTNHPECISYPSCQKTAINVMSVQTATPLAEDNWSRLVAGGMSIFRRIFPLISPGAPIENIKDIPAKTKASYTSANLGVTGGRLAGQQTSAGADNLSAGDASLYFPHIGSLHDYFLNGIQCALRPFGYCGNANYSGDEAPIENAPVCSIQNSVIASQELRNIIAAAANWARIPVQSLVTVVRVEGCGGGDRTGGICTYTDDQVLQYSAPGAIDPRNCPATGSKGPLQMYEDSVNWSPWKNAVNMATGASRDPQICNIKDAIYAGAYRLSAGYDGCPNAGHDINSVPQPWSETQVQKTLTAWAAGCSAPLCGGTAAGFYCSKYSEWSSQIVTNCN